MAVTESCMYNGGSNELEPTSTKANTLVVNPSETATQISTSTQAVSEVEQLSTTVAEQQAQIANQQATIGALQTQAAASPTKQNTETPTPTEDVSQYKQNNNWDGQTSGPMGTNINEGDVVGWDNKMLDLTNNKRITKGDVRSFDKAQEVVKEDPGLPFFTKPDGKLPQAKEVLGQASNIGAAVLSEAGYSNLDQAEAKKWGTTIISNSFGVSKDGKTLYTRNFYPRDTQGVTREVQMENSICSQYVEWIPIGGEKRQNGVLLESNQAPLVMFFTVTDKALTTTEVQTLHRLPIKDASGKWKSLYWRWEDWGSEPGKDAGFDRPADYQGHGWQSTMGTGCGIEVAAPTLAPEATPTPTMQATSTKSIETPQVTITATLQATPSRIPSQPVTATLVFPTPTEFHPTFTTVPPTKTEVPPTRVPTQPAPTVTAVIPTSTEFHPTFTSVPPTRIPTQPAPSVVPTKEQPTVQPTPVPPTKEQPTAVPPTEVPPTRIPTQPAPTRPSVSDLFPNGVDAKIRVINRDGTIEEHNGLPLSVLLENGVDSGEIIVL